MTVREMVGEVFTEARTTKDLSPIRAAQLETRLSSLLPNVLTEIREADVEFNLTLLQCLRDEKTATKARIVAETSPQYRRRQEARDLEKAAVEMIRSLRHLGRVEAAAMQLQR
jgi:hypothetical protein